MSSAGSGSSSQKMSNGDSALAARRAAGRSHSWFASTMSGRPGPMIHRAALGDRAAVRVDHGLDRLRTGPDGPAETLPAAAVAAVDRGGDEVLARDHGTPIDRGAPRPGHGQPVGPAGYPRDMRAGHRQSFCRSPRGGGPPGGNGG